MLRQFVFAPIVAIAMVGCQSAQQQTNDWSTIVGKTLAAGDYRFTLWPDGRLTGTLPSGVESAGRWEERDGKYCRTLTSPKDLAERFPPECQTVVVEGDTVRFISENGRTSTWKVE